MVILHYLNPRYNVTEKPTNTVLVYGSKTWSTTLKDEQNIAIFVGKISASNSRANEITDYWTIWQKKKLRSIRYVGRRGYSSKNVKQKSNCDKTMVSECKNNWSQKW